MASVRHTVLLMSAVSTNLYKGKPNAIVKGGSAEEEHADRATLWFHTPSASSNSAGAVAGTRCHPHGLLIETSIAAASTARAPHNSTASGGVAVALAESK